MHALPSPDLVQQIDATPARETPRWASAASDAQLLEWIGKVAGDRDQAALGRLYDATAKRIYAVALRFVRDPHCAEEVVSDVYMQVWNEAHLYDPSRAHVMPWMLVCCRTRALDHLRRNQVARKHCVDDGLTEDEGPSAEDAFDGFALFERQSAVRAALDRMTPLQRQLLALSFFRGLSHSEIAAREGLPLGSVKSHIRGALQRLRTSLTEFE